MRCFGNIRLCDFDSGGVGFLTYDGPATLAVGKPDRAVNHCLAGHGDILTACMAKLAMGGQSTRQATQKPHPLKHKHWDFYLAWKDSQLWMSSAHG